MITIIWVFEIRPEARSAFEAAYGKGGAWAQLFGVSDAFIEVELLHDGANRYATVDRWRSRGAFEAFKRANRSAYGELDRTCAALTVSEQLIGVFGAPD